MRFYSLDRVSHQKNRSPEGALTTSLPEDVFSLLQSDANVLQDIVFDNDDDRIISLDSKTCITLWVDGMLHVLSVLKNIQTRTHLLFVTTLFDTCAAANDFLRMSELMEAFLEDLFSKFTFLSTVNDDENQLVLKLRDAGNGLVTLFSQDAVMAAERSQVFIMREIQTTSIATDFFSSDWEEEWTQNEVAMKMIEFFEDYLTRIKRYLISRYLYQKAVITAQKAMVCFYVRCLVKLAESLTRRWKHQERLRLHIRERKSFRSHDRALRRMADDVTLMKECFRERAEGNPTMLRIMSDDMAILELILECLRATDSESLESFIVVMHKRTGADPLVTRFFVGDMWTLTTDKHGRSLINSTLENLYPDLQMVTIQMKEMTAVEEEDLTFVRLDYMLKALYEDRVAQGILPACWVCLPKDEDNEVVIKQIRSFTRNLVEMKWVRKPANKHNVSR